MIGVFKDNILGMLQENCLEWEKSFCQLGLKIIWLKLREGPKTIPYLLLFKYTSVSNMQQFVKIQNGGKSMWLILTWLLLPDSVWNLFEQTLCQICEAQNLYISSIKVYKNSIINCRPEYCFIVYCCITALLQFWPVCSQNDPIQIWWRSDESCGDELEKAYFCQNSKIRKAEKLYWVWHEPKNQTKYVCF